MRRFLILVVISLIVWSIDAQQNDPPIPCTKDQECAMLKTSQKNPTCKGGFCACLNEQQKLQNCSSLAVRALPVTGTAPQLYHACKIDGDCTQKNTFCNTTRSQCECLKGYVASGDQPQCLQGGYNNNYAVAKSLGSPCIDNRQCLAFQANTICLEQQCICVNNYHAVDDVCWKTAAIDGPCIKDQECYHINGAFCTDKKICGCGEKKVIDKNMRNCISIAESIGDYCKNNSHCSRIENSICVDEKCQCPKDKHYVETLKKCIYNKGLNEQCEHDYDCYQPGEDTNSTINLFQCLGSRCDCKENYVRSQDTCMSAGVPTAHFSLFFILSIIVCGLYHQ